MGTEAREEIKAKQLEKVIYFAANLVTWVDEERRHADLDSLEQDMLAEKDLIEKDLRLELDRRHKDLEDEVKGLEKEGAKDADIKARQRAADKDLQSIRERYDMERDLVERCVRRVQVTLRTQDHRRRNALA